MPGLLSKRTLYMVGSNKDRIILHDQAQLGGPFLLSGFSDKLDNPAPDMFKLSFH